MSAAVNAFPCICTSDGRAWDFFQGRLMIPVRDLKGRTIGFGARRLSDEDKRSPKYVNTPETPLFHKGRVIYALEAIRDGDPAEAAYALGDLERDLLAHIAGARRLKLGLCRRVAGCWAGNSSLSSQAFHCRSGVACQ